MPSGTGISAWATIGPVSNPASMRWTVTPVTRSPRRNVQNTGSGPRPAGRSEGWTLRMPSGGVSRASRGSRQRKQAATATSGARLRIASVASAADVHPDDRDARRGGDALDLAQPRPRLPRQDDRRDREPGLEQRRQGRHRRGARLTEEEDARRSGSWSESWSTHRGTLSASASARQGHQRHGRTKIAGDEEPEKLTRSASLPYGSRL